MNEQMLKGKAGAVDKKDLRIMVIGAHPDDADIQFGGSAVKFARAGARVRFVSCCNGNKGHQTMSSADLAARRYQETQRSAKILGVEDYTVLSSPDCEIVPTVELRAELTRIVRRFSPHLVFTHRLCDYHADHRAVAQLVQDLTYLLGVPLWCPDVPIPSVKPAVFFLSDDFTSPRPLRPDAIVPIDDAVDTSLDAIREHVSQVFEWLPWDMELPASDVPDPSDVAASRAFVDKWFCTMKHTDLVRFEPVVREWFPDGPLPKEIEVFEMSEYGRRMSSEEIRQCFTF